LAFLAPIALATTAFDAPVGVVRHHPLHLSCQTETQTVAAAEGAKIDTIGLEQLRSNAADTMRTSMQNDVVAGRSPELDAIGGAVQRAAARHHIATPATDKLIEMVRSRLPTSPQLSL
jgi:2-dehydropantoate 2-reductase